MFMTGFFFVVIQGCFYFNCTDFTNGADCIYYVTAGSVFFPSSFLPLSLSLTTLKTKDWSCTFNIVSQGMIWDYLNCIVKQTDALFNCSSTTKINGDLNCKKKCACSQSTTLDTPIHDMQPYIQT